MDEIKKIDEVVQSVTKYSLVHVPIYSERGVFEGVRDVCTDDIAKALYEAGCRIVVTCKSCIFRREDKTCLDGSLCDDDHFCGYGERMKTWENT